MNESALHVAHRRVEVSFLLVIPGGIADTPHVPGTSTTSPPPKLTPFFCAVGRSAPPLAVPVQPQVLQSADESGRDSPGALVVTPVSPGPPPPRSSLVSSDRRAPEPDADAALAVHPRRPGRAGEVSGAHVDDVVVL